MFFLVFLTITFNGESCLLENSKVANLLGLSVIELYGIHTIYVREWGSWHSNHATK